MVSLIGKRNHCGNLGYNIAEGRIEIFTFYLMRTNNVTAFKEKLVTFCSGTTPLTCGSYSVLAIQGTWHQQSSRSLHLYTTGD